MTIQMFEKPLGMRDDFPSIVKRKSKLSKVGIKIMEQFGYEMLQTPSLEYYETIGKISAIADNQLFKLLDNQGQTLVLRPDMTSPIARVAASKLLKEKMPVRLGYYSNVFRAQLREGGRPAEFEQIGVELIGDESLYADAEVILLATEILRGLKVESGRIVIGHTQLLQEVLRGYGLDAALAEKLRAEMVAKNKVAYENMVDTLVDDAETKSSLKMIMNTTRLEDWEQWIDQTDPVQRSLYEDIRKLKTILDRNGLADFVTYDLSFTSHMTYYTGMVFEIYGEGSGFPLGNGGRYDGLMKQFGLHVGATGFSLRVDRLLEAMPAEQENPEQTLILYNEKNEENAHKEAEKLRTAGTRVTLQFAPAVKAQEEFSSLFSKVIRMDGENNG
ncbi:ATP phosphoribosyltransferase regulatory subunit [Planomicrobium sp. Y74]|uniref:ATP phosphoribosyltransferase regulatory subunit n=1 Tax=Planomicrobium sp. Y74 TaxID=2478977 RepID=UPI000EF4AC40|nr:ATP phosphoribosyltransferase regulatory subunit [Planomicrobium sp. Y74]RLQ85091.1 ATP phosphoribosyltransferase regulatory subunit [Planomicrobium sp. Y74]